MAHEIRPFDGDYATLLALADAAVPFDPEGNRQWLRQRRQFDEARRIRRHYLVKETESGQAIAYGTIEQDPGNPRRFRLFVLTDPARLDTGIGDRLIDRLFSDLRALGARAAWAREYGRDAQLLDFFRRHGFAVTQRVWDLRLPVAEIETLDEGPGAGPLAITSLAAERRRIDDALPRLHRAVNELLAQTVDPDRFAPIPFDQFVGWLDRPGLSPQAYFIARDGEIYAGVSVWIEEQAQAGILTQEFTAVRPAYRSHDLAAALRRAALAYARQKGYAALVAHVPAGDAEALAAHEALGFRRRFEYVTLEKGLDVSKDAQ
jgi:GNAT superfamily N-acetyltransferase/N-acetylglutamate synthase-like GNAT family acetyltransferase